MLARKALFVLKPYEKLEKKQYWKKNLLEKSVTNKRTAQECVIKEEIENIININIRRKQRSNTDQV